MSSSWSSFYYYAFFATYDDTPHRYPADTEHDPLSTTQQDDPNTFELLASSPQAGCLHSSKTISFEYIEQEGTPESAQEPTALDTINDLSQEEISHVLPQETAIEPLPEKESSQNILQHTEPAADVTPSSTKAELPPAASPSFSTTSAPQRRKRFSLAQLGKGFLNYLEDEGDRLITIQSNITGTRHAAHIQAEQFMAKVLACLNTEFSIHRHEQPSLTSPLLQVPVRITLYAQQDQLAQFAIEQSSGNSDIDRFVILIFKQAASNFPHVPTFFKEDHITTTILCEFHISPKTSSSYKFRFPRI